MNEDILRSIGVMSDTYFSTADDESVSVKIDVTQENISTMGTVRTLCKNDDLSPNIGVSRDQIKLPHVSIVPNTIGTDDIMASSHNPDEEKVNHT